MLISQILIIRQQIMERKLLLLGLLRKRGMHGYRLHEFIERNLSPYTDLKKPTAYYLLDQMVRDGWLTAEVEQEGQRPPRRVYHLTPAGEEAFQRLLREALATAHPMTFPGDIALGFLDELPKEEAIQLLETRKHALEERLKNLQRVPPHPGSLQWLFEHQIHHLRSELEWLEKLILRLKEENP